ncbi:MoxR family ATPase [Catenovulum sp. SM1970]|uniref:AAA family ATPase n=1 Tax=Marinifaba aquimaris TaxID=2741323 RepID=UPI001574358E|nr:MoxR family ATPase [Marinifaba aquimaris]NTS75479.1 MoxR family ATPase [Marinifaba aquimaris]
MQAVQLCQQALNQIDKVVIGKERQVKLALCCLLAKGHLLIEDLPGMGKTTLSHALANSLGLSYRRIQFTSDLLPADVIGVSIFNQNQHQFEFHPGPIFSQVVLADEINRASPKTQSALLEAMEEKQISVDGQSHSLPAPFFVIATQNPFHQSGTFPLPESQLDRFLMRIELGFPSKDAERTMLLNEGNEVVADLKPVMSIEEFTSLQTQVQSVAVTDKLINYLLNLVHESRNNAAFDMALSPRASKGILSAARAWAMLSGRDYVTADDIKAVFPAIAEHRLGNGKMNTSVSLSEQLMSQVEPI